MKQRHVIERLWAVCAWQGGAVAVERRRRGTTWVGQCSAGRCGAGEEEQCEGLGLGRLFGVSVAGLQMWLSYWRGCRLGEEGPPVGALEHPYMLKSGRAGVSSEGDVVGKVGGRRLGVPCRPGGRCQSQILELLRRHQVPCGLLPPAGGLPGGRPVVLSPLRLIGALEGSASAQQPLAHAHLVRGLGRRRLQDVSPAESGGESDSIPA